MILSQKYDTIIFDMDGVITSEQRYWDAAALTVACAEGIESRDAAYLRSVLFYDDRLIRFFKEKGINSNWDLAYLVRAYMPEGGTGKDVYDRLCGTEMLAFELYTEAAKLLAQKLSLPEADTVREGKVWREMQDDFQHWFLGSETYAENGGTATGENREGLYKGEKPLLETVIPTLKALYDKGLRLCIATGRPLKEAMLPLEVWGIKELFDADGIASYNHIRNAEEALGLGGKLTKPHPYIFLKAFLGTHFADKDIVDGNFSADLSRCLAVGDAGADMLSAQGAKMDFAAVLTGISGKDARGYFEENGATYILDTIEEIK